MPYEAVIGLEVHAELRTASKMFCGCDAHAFGAAPNTHVCPVCLGMPGALPVVNRMAVDYAIMGALALHCEVADVSVFARKNYTYPDLPKGYQISQYEQPVGIHGWLDVPLAGAPKRIGITRVHLEEDTAKLSHVDECSLVDYNRSGIPLLEIVTEPDIRSAEEARQALVQLQQVLRYLRISSADMEKGAMRCEANVSVRPQNSAAFGTKVEVKNLNSFRSVKLALGHEIERQSSVLRSGGAVEQVTVGWDEERRCTVVQRKKESSHDYRYFPEPDLPPLVIDSAWVKQACSRLPELADARLARFEAQCGITKASAELLTQDRDVADYFEEAVGAYGGSAASVASWIMGEMFRLMRAAGKEIGQVGVPAAELADLLRLVDEGTISATVAKRTLARMSASGSSAREIVRAEGLGQVSDTDALTAVVEAVIDACPDEVGKYLGGKTQVLGWLVGRVMQETEGKANPTLVRSVLAERLSRRQQGQSPEVESQT
jgi:aspartyl-tRNA(Asn)/glutamyl-tRNA(Gln) amidotransferase subunit B